MTFTGKSADMHVDIFIRTYKNDLPWLAYALKSIHKYVTGYRNIIVAIPMDQVRLLSHLSVEKVVGVHDLEDGYLGQQLTKMQAWKLTDADAVVFWDSDVVATRPIDIKDEYFTSGCSAPRRIKMYKTRYSSMPDNPWRPIVAKAMAVLDPEWEYMRRMPLVYWRSTLEGCQHFMENIHKCSLESYLRAQPHRAFSEFNTLGTYAKWFGSERSNIDTYEFIDTESIDMPPCAVDQMWSWGGLTHEVMEKMRAYGLA